MRKTAAPLLLVALLTCTPASAGPAAPTREARLQSNLRVNRMLLARYSRELGQLRRGQRKVYSERCSERMEGLRTQIRALKEDAERLRSRLPISAQADSFLQNFIRRNGKPAAPPKKGPPTPQVETARLHEEALKLVAAQNLKEAAKRYEEIVIVNPDDDQAYLLLGHVYLMMGQYDRAEFAYYNAVHIDRENYTEIIPFYQNLVVQRPNDDIAYCFLGYAYVILGDAVRAKDAYQESLRINPSNLEAHKGLAILSQRFGI